MRDVLVAETKTPDSSPEMQSPARGWHLTSLTGRCLQDKEVLPSSSFGTGKAASLSSLAPSPDLSSE